MKGKYVFDASTLILMAKVTILRRFAESNDVKITIGVRDESICKKEADDAKIVGRLIGEEIIKTYKGNTSWKRLAEDFALGAGEAESLGVAFKEVRILATDDGRAIRASKVLDVRFVTALHCLVWLYNNGKIDSKEAHEKMKGLERYGRYSTEIIRDATGIIKGDVK